MDGFTTNLHYYWDKGGYYLESEDTNKTRFLRPLNNSAIISLEKWAHDLTLKYPRTFFKKKLEIKNINQW